VSRSFGLLVSGQSDIVDLLLANGADVNQQARNGKTPLHVACEKGFAEIATILLEVLRAFISFLIFVLPFSVSPLNLFAS
jgi:ankyrin repeat protein